MRILIDARYLDGSYSGIGTYSTLLMEHLSRLDQENTYLVLVRPGLRQKLALGDNFQLLSWPAQPVSLSTLTLLGRHVDSLGVDVMHSLFPLAPLQMKTRLMVTVHDLQPFIDPDFSSRRAMFVKWGYSAFYRLAYPATMRRAKWIIADSYYTRDTVAELFPQFIPKLVVVAPGLSRTFLLGHPQDEGEVRLRHGLLRPYFLYYGSTRPNKNLPMMVRAFGRFCEAHPEQDHEFVMILKRDRFFQDVEAVLKNSSWRARVKVIDQVTPEDQRGILAGARGFMFATKYEGFGFPALEAMAMGVPVIAGDSGALPEICGEAAEIVTPGHERAITEAISRIALNDERRRELIDRGRARAVRFDWADSAERVRDIYRLLC